MNSSNVVAKMISTNVCGTCDDPSGLTYFDNSMPIHLYTSPNYFHLDKYEFVYWYAHGSPKGPETALGGRPEHIVDPGLITFGESYNRWIYSDACDWFNINRDEYGCIQPVIVTTGSYSGITYDAAKKQVSSCSNGDWVKFGSSGDGGIRILNQSNDDVMFGERSYGNISWEYINITYSSPYQNNYKNGYIEVYLAEKRLDGGVYNWGYNPKFKIGQISIYGTNNTFKSITANLDLSGVDKSYFNGDQTYLIFKFMGGMTGVKIKGDIKMYHEVSQATSYNIVYKALDFSKYFGGTHVIMGNEFYGTSNTDIYEFMQRWIVNGNTILDAFFGNTTLAFCQSLAMMAASKDGTIATSYFNETWANATVEKAASGFVMISYQLNDFRSTPYSWSWSGWF